MSREKGPKPNQDQQRRDRLSQQLRDNLARRKAQARARRAGDADERDEGIRAAQKAEKGPADGG
ncbi:MAG: hypothetical protein KF849_12945 [Rhizobiaceae bacterium]|nr:hypothetical protein [Rhizobiaceae bacterium]